MHIIAAALAYVILPTFLIGAAAGYIIPGKSNRRKWYIVMGIIAVIASLLFSLGAYVFTQASVLFFASTQVGLMTLKYSLLTFFFLITLFMVGMWVGDLIEHATARQPASVYEGKLKQA